MSRVMMTIDQWDDLWQRANRRFYEKAAMVGGDIGPVDDRGRITMAAVAAAVEAYEEMQREWEEGRNCSRHVFGEGHHE